MEIYKAITERRTIRKFKQQKIEKDILEKLVNAARLAPSAGNLQPCEYMVIDEPALADQIFTSVRFAAYLAPHGTPALDKKPTAYIIVLKNTNINTKYAEVDMAAGIMNIILAGWELSIGCCWIASIDKEKLKEIIKIPDNMEIGFVLALGYKDEQPKEEELKDSVKYWKDEKGVLHVPKRKLKDILHWNGYGEKSK